MARTLLRVLALSVVLMTALAACEPTGHPDCDAYWGPQVVIEANGYRLDCTPGFDNVRGDTGAKIHGWTDHNRQTVWVWPDALRPEWPRYHDRLKKLLWHETAHVVGYSDEWLADVYAWCSVRPSERNGLTYRSPIPTAADCWRVGK